MCRQEEKSLKTKTKQSQTESNEGKARTAEVIAASERIRDDKPQRPRRGKRDKEGEYTLVVTTNDSSSAGSKAPKNKKKKKKSSKALKKHGKDNPSGGLESLLPSLIGVSVLVMAVMAQRGFRGRASVAGIDLGTTNSVICIQRLSKGVGVIDCVEDPLTGSPIVPSVVSVYDAQRESHEIKVGPSSKTTTLLEPHPSRVVVGRAAKRRIDTHPHQTLYNAKRVLGRPHDDPAVEDLRNEVEFRIEKDDERRSDENDEGSSSSSSNQEIIPPESIFRVDHGVGLSPQQVGGHVVHFLIGLARDFLGHDNVKSAVLAVPAKFDAHQRKRTFEAFRLAGVKVARVLEEPTAAALAYGLHKKEGVEKILVYDFGGGTLDISVLHVSEGYCDVMGSDGDDRLGGADFDTAVAHLLTQQHAEVLENLSAFNNHDDDEKSDMAEILASSCDRVTDDLPLCSVSSFHTLGEKVKISLSQQQQRQQQSDEQGKHSNESIVARTECLALPPFAAATSKSSTVQSLCESLTVEALEVTLEDYNNVCKPLFDRSVIPAKRLIEDLTLKIEEIDEIVMVGGTTRMPQIRELVRSAFPNAQLNTHIDPDVTVAYGAASVID